MANHKSAIRKHRRDEKRRMINKMNRTKMKNRIKLLRRQAAEGNTEQLKELLPKVVSIIDKTVTKGTIPQNTGSRYKSRLHNLVRKAGIET